MSHQKTQDLSRFRKNLLWVWPGACHLGSPGLKQITKISVDVGFIACRSSVSKASAVQEWMHECRAG